MIGYVTLGTKDFKKATAFYDALIGEMGGKRVMDYGSFIVWGTKAGGAGLALVEKTANGAPATVGNGVMVALAADSKETVDRIYKKALELGGTDEGPAGPRGDTFYAGYFRDLDGNKLNIYVMGK